MTKSTVRLTRAQAEQRYVAIRSKYASLLAGEEAARLADSELEHALLVMTDLDSGQEAGCEFVIVANSWRQDL